MLKVLWANISSLDTNYDGLPLSLYRREKLNKIKLPQKIKQSIGAELLLIEAVRSVFPEESLPFEICCGQFQKPYFKDIPLYFSLSHSGDYAVCALSDKEIGVDIEHGTVYKPDVAKRFFTLDEQTRIDLSQDKDFMFCRIWTAKESALKLLGTGLTKPLSAINVISDNKVLVNDIKDNLYLSTKVINGVTISICSYQAEEAEIKYIDFNKKK